MKRLVVLGAGTAGTMVVNKLARVLSKGEWEIVSSSPPWSISTNPGTCFFPSAGTNRLILSSPINLCSRSEFHLLEPRSSASTPPRQFAHTKRNAALRQHKDRHGYRCSGRHGRYVEQRY